MARWTVLIAGALITSAIGCSSSTDEKTQVVQECKDSVQGQLTYNADFPFFDPSPEKDSSGTWHVNGTVKAQNGFGATRTVPWTCTVDKEDNVQSTVG